MTVELFDKFSKQTNIALVLDHSGRSGNGFFLTIFDQHKEVLSCPWMHYVYSYFIKLYGENEYVNRDDVLKNWINQRYFKLLNQTLDKENYELIKKMGGDPNAEIDRHLVNKVFSNIIQSRQQIHRRDVILATYFAYAFGIGRDVEDIKYILASDSISLKFESVFTGFSGKVIDIIIQDFPDANILHLVRDPRAGFASSNHQFINQLGNMYGLKWGNALSRAKRILNFDFDWDSVFVFGFWLMYFRQTFEASLRKQNEYPENFKIIRNEELNLNFSKTMRNISVSLGITYLPAWDKNDKFQPTMLGKPWKGTGAYNNQYSPSTRLENDPDEVALRSAGPNRHVTERWKKKLKNNEILLIEKFLRPEFSAFGYEQISNNNSNLRWLSGLAKPLKGELPSIHWLADGWKSGKEIFRDRLFYTFVWPLYYILARWAFLEIVNNTCVFKKDCFTENKSAHE